MTVELDLSVAASAIIMPAGIPGYESFSVKQAHNLDNVDMGACAVLVVPDLQLRLKTHDYYMGTSPLVQPFQNLSFTACFQRWP